MGKRPLIPFLDGTPLVRAFAPGRTEIAGNHVDHQGGRVITAALARGIKARACENESDLVRIESAGFAPFEIDLAEMRACLSPDPHDFGTSRALVAGMIATLEERDRTSGHARTVRGFDLEATSALPAGGGLSSSASFELLIGVVVNKLFFDDTFTAIDLATAAQRAEAAYFGKPCGLMDQAAIATGGIAALDFARDIPSVEKIDAAFERTGMSVVLVDVHADHAQATPSYAAIPGDMAAAAHYFGKDRLCDIKRETLEQGLPALRDALGDRIALRALHYLRETDLVRARESALASGDAAAFCAATALSAASSAQYLQNVSEPGAEAQPAMAALALADLVLDELAQDDAATGENALAPWPRGVARIHGGGFGGSIQVFLPTKKAEAFAARIDGLLGEGSALVLAFSDKGAHAAWM